jgi:hypothetical protein
VRHQRQPTVKEAAARDIELLEDFIVCAVCFVKHNSEPMYSVKSTIFCQTLQAEIQKNQQKINTDEASKVLHHCESTLIMRLYYLYFPYAWDNFEQVTLALPTK